MKFSNLKKFKIAFLALLLGFTVILGSGCKNNKEDDEKQKVEETQKKQEEAKKEQEKKEDEKKEADKKEDDKKQNNGKKLSEEAREGIKQGVDILNKTYNGKMAVKFIEEKNDFVFEYVGEFKDYMIKFMDDKDNENYKNSWNLMVTNLSKYSENIKKLQPGMSYVIVNPKDASKELLRIKDGVVVYDYFK